MWSSHATKRPVPYSGLHARVKRRAALVHTNGGGTDHGSLFGFWCGNANGSHGTDNRHVGAHFQVMTNGAAEQYVDTDLVIYHAYGASEWAVGIEVEDDDNPSTPMTGPQLTTIEAIMRELAVPARILTSDQPGDGVGWHEEFPAWNQSGHTCPGPAREGQVRSRIIPALAAAPLSIPWWWHRTLREGMSGTDVAACKHRMWRLGYHSLVFSPSFGPGLTATIMHFQTRAHLPATGIIDRVTAHAIHMA